MRSAALEGGPEGERVNSINLSPVETRMMRSLEAGMDPADPEGVHARYARSSPLGRYAEPEEIAKVMLFLAADESSHCSGSVYMVDGARNAR
jgi:NAD(P)-dependent dehydrogenase (short-subunit alcohol dehydrogenase family)